jgi:CubicO group peptidase (beta-lactamase class C family)
MIRTLLLLPILFWSSVACSQPSVDSIFKKAGVSGAQLVVVRDGQTMLYCYGKASDDKNDTVNASTVFQAASLSKIVLAYIAMKLVDRNQIALDTPLYRYYAYARTNSDTNAKKITARMVLHHVTGYPNWASNPGSKEWGESPLVTTFTPGTKWKYSGEGFMYLQFAVEAILKSPLEKIASEEVFGPLNMKSSSFLWQPSFGPKAAYSYNEKGEIGDRPEFFLPSAAYSLMTTATDFNYLIQAVVNGTGLNNATCKMMLNDLVEVKNTDASDNAASSHIKWALGIGVEQNEMGKAFWHWGDNGSYKAFVIAFPDKKASLCYFTNSANGLDRMSELLDYYFGKANWWALKWLEEDF